MNTVGHPVPGVPVPTRPRPYNLSAGRQYCPMEPLAPTTRMRPSGRSSG